jgi:CRP/FNR family transcriptional regulator, polysaccharide utilization system transcription regulator
MGKSILVIEDNKEMRENISEILALANYSVFSAQDGKEGVNMAKKSPPELIICDIMMPKMDGYETLYLLSKDEKTNHIPFIFLSAKAEKSDWRKGMNLGADDYLTKPFEEMELLNAVETRLKRSSSLKQKFSSNIEDLSRFMDTAKGVDGLKSLTLNKKNKVYKKKDVLYHEGDYAGSVFFIESGKIKTFKVNDGDKEYATGLFGKGDFVGYMALLKNTEQPDSAIALEESVVYRIHKDDFTKLIYTNKEVAKTFINILSGNLIEKEQELINLAYNSVRKRVADSLLLLQRKYNDDHAKNFSISLLRDDLASIVGTSTESVIRVISDFKEEGFIEVHGGKITIIDSEGLTHLHQ